MSRFFKQRSFVRIINSSWRNGGYCVSFRNSALFEFHAIRNRTQDIENKQRTYVKMLAEHCSGDAISSWSSVKQRKWFCKNVSDVLYIYIYMYFTMWCALQSTSRLLAALAVYHKRDAINERGLSPAARFRFSDGCAALGSSLSGWTKISRHPDIWAKQTGKKRSLQGERNARGDREGISRVQRTPSAKLYLEFAVILAHSVAIVEAVHDVLPRRHGLDLPACLPACIVGTRHSRLRSMLTRSTLEEKLSPHSF